MVIIRILGGFASQLGKYVLGYSLARAKGTELILDISEYLDGYFRPFMLSYLNLPNCKVVNGVEGLNNIVRVSSGEQLIEVFEQKEFPNVYIYLEEVDYEAFFDKYPQYRINKDSELLKGLSLKVQSERINNFIKLVTPQNAVAVHVRRGDFVTLGWQDDAEKYQEAIGHVLKENPKAKVVFFSNDIEWVKNKYGNHPQFYFVSNENGYIGDVEDFFCLSMCKWKILSSMSGYSRYANYLGKNTFDTEPAIVLGDTADTKEWLQTLTSDQRILGKQCYDSLEINHNEDNFLKNQKHKFFEKDRGYALQNVNSIQKELLCEFWKMHYGVENVNEKSIVIVTREVYDRWKWKGMFLVANILARVGVDVLYVNMNMFAATDVQRGKIINAKDMDNNDLGFELFFADKSVFDINNVIEEWNKKSSDVRVCSDVLVWTNKKVTYIKRKERNIRYNIKLLLYFWKQCWKCLRILSVIRFDEKINNQCITMLGDANVENVLNYAEEKALNVVKEIIR